MKRFMTFALIAMLFSGCSSDNKSATAVEPLPAVGQEPAPLGPWTMTSPDDGKAATATFLQLEKIEGNQAFLLLKVRGVQTMQGIAFRLAYPPAQVHVVKIEETDVFTKTGNKYLARFTPRPEGEIWGGIGFVGYAPMTTDQEIVAARLQVELAGADPVTINFRDSHNAILGTDMAKVESAWFGATFSRQAP